jgi:hypothetical protein
VIPAALIDFRSPKLLAKMSAGAPGAESKNQLFKSKTTFYLI